MSSSINQYRFPGFPLLLQGDDRNIQIKAQKIHWDFVFVSLSVYFLGFSYLGGPELIFSRLYMQCPKFWQIWSMENSSKWEQGIMYSKCTYLKVISRDIS